MDKEVLRAERARNNERLGELEAELLQCKERRDKVQKKKIMNELRVLASRQRHIAFKLGEFRYEEDEVVEHSPGEFMPANIYHWLKD